MDSDSINTDMIDIIDIEARKNDCLCLDKEYIDNNTPLSFICKKGHLWEKTLKQLKSNKIWCPKCTIRTKLAEKIQKMMAERKGIVCLTPDITSSDHLIFICQKKHIWKTTATCVIYGKSWCRKCVALKQRSGISVAQKIAKERGGFCLSKNYKNAHSKLLWMCKMKHKWYACLHSIKRKGWCPHCKINTNEAITRKIFEVIFNEKFIKIKPDWLNGLELDGFCEKLNLAFEYDGQQHYQFSKFFHRTEEKFERSQMMDILKNIKCKDQGIILIRIPYWIKLENLQQYIVNKCNEFKIIIPNNVEIDYKTFTDIYEIKHNKYLQLKEHVEAKGGTLLTDVYINTTEIFQVKCSNEHIWSTNYTRLVKSNQWCQRCVAKQNALRRHQK